MPENKQISCWCGNQDLSYFSSEYVVCESCKTLVLKEWTDDGLFSVKEDDRDFYGKSYWFEHQENDLGFGNILSRARTDLPERVLHWLAMLLKYKVPPGKTLELGCSHGGFVAMLQWAGYDATGTEMSPWVVDFAHNTFQIPMLVGEVEKLDLPLNSFDVVALMDVLEHLPDPVATMSHCLNLMKPDGILLIQTPRYQEGGTYQQMLDANDAFMEQFKPPQHVYLFSQSSVTEMFHRIGAEYIVFEQPFFSQYDMFFVVSRQPLQVQSKEQIEQSLMSTPGGRLILALLDKQIELEFSHNKWQEAETDREARLRVIMELGQQYSEVRELLRNISNSRLYRIIRRLGLWEWVENAIKTLGK